MRLSDSHPSHSPWKSPKSGDYHIPTARRLRRYTDISNGRTTLSFLSGANRGCKRKVEVSGFCKVEMSKLPFRQLRRRRLGLLTMSGNELQRIEVLSEVLSGRRTEA